MQQNERKSSRTRSPRGRSPSGGQVDGGPQGMPLTGGGGLARVPNLRARAPFGLRGGTRRGGRMNKHPAVVPSSRRGKNLQ